MAYIGNTPISAAFLVDTFSGNGSTVNYTMTVAPANTSSIIVAITGVVQDPSTYAVNGTTLTFSQAPPSGTSNISVRYLGIPASGVTTTAYRTVTDITATSGQTTFTIPSYTVGFVDVFRNGVRLAAADYTATTGTTIVLVNGATVGDTITTVSFLVSSVLNAIPATAGSVGTTFLADSSVTTAKIAAGAVVQADLATGVAGTGPAFNAFKSANQTISHNTLTKVTFDTESYDTNNNFASSTFTPTVAGYYQLIPSIDVQTTFNRAYYIDVRIYKNGSAIKFTTLSITPSNGSQNTINAMYAPVYMNGTTDTLEIYVYHFDYTASSSITVNGTSANTTFGAYLVRAA